MRPILLVATLAALLTSCAQVRGPQALPTIQEELQAASQAPKPTALPPQVEAALAPPTTLKLPEKATRAIEPRFDLVVNDAPASEVFMGIVSGTRYSMLLAPGISGRITVNLKDVTVPEAMEAIRTLYGYDYRIDGSRIFVQPLALQTRFYSIPYLPGVRQGTSELRVTSGGITNAPMRNAPGTPTPTNGTPEGGAQTSRLSTMTQSDFWAELRDSVRLLIGCVPSAQGPEKRSVMTNQPDQRQPALAADCPEGRSVMTSPQTGMLAVRAYPAEHRLVEDYLKAARLVVERQVMIEAKIIEVTLDEGAQNGINWARFRAGSGTHLFSKGTNASQLPIRIRANTNQSSVTGQPGAGQPLEPGQPGAGQPPVADPNRNTDLATLLGGGLAGAAAATASGLFGLAFQTGSFAALIEFLQTQGSVQVLSSPRIAVVNNQKAVLKVGTDEFFVTNVSTTTTTGTATTTTPSVTLNPFFSGIALDVTPQIDERDNIILHVHPSVSQVTTVEKTVSFGSGYPPMTLPLASSTVSETDSIVRLKDGQIVAIGGLMRQESRDFGGQVPVAGDVPVLGAFFKNTSASRRKTELVILLKPTIIRQPTDWLDSARGSAARLMELTD